MLAPGTCDDKSDPISGLLKFSISINRQNKNKKPQDEELDVKT